MVPAFVRVEAPTWEEAVALLPQEWCDDDAEVEVEGGVVRVGWLLPERADDVTEVEEDAPAGPPFGPLTLRDTYRAEYIQTWRTAPSDLYLDALMAAHKAQAHS